jgi:hypothetical protein
MMERDVAAGQQLKDAPAPEPLWRYCASRYWRGATRPRG